MSEPTKPYIEHGDAVGGTPAMLPDNTPPLTKEQADDVAAGRAAVMEVGGQRVIRYNDDRPDVSI